MENQRKAKGPDLKGRQWLVVIMVDVFILAELAAAMYVASTHRDDFELVFMKCFFGLLVPTLVLGFLAKYLMRRAPKQAMS